MLVFARLAYAYGVGVDELLFIRFGFAFLIVGGILAAGRRLVLPKREDLLVLLGLGALGYFVQSTLYFTAVIYSPVAIVALILYTYPVFVTIGAFALGWEKISRGLAATLIIALLGLVLVASPFGNQVGLGAILALGASVTYTLYILCGSRVLRRVDGELAAFFVMGAASVSFGLDGVLTGSIHANWSLRAWLWVAIIAVFCTAIAVTAFFLGLSKIGPSKSSLISLIEPVTSILVSTWLFGNALTFSQWFGGFLILAATAIITLYGKVESSPLTEPDRHAAEGTVSVFPRR
jgi:drug/metabolite transporter (DMT)-like permease